MAKGTVNKVIILGRLGADPEVRTTASGTQVVNLNVATNELGPKEPNNNQRADITEWHRVTLFGRMAENAAQYLKKGSQVYIEGRLQTRKWQDQQGNDRYSTDIIGNEMQFIGGRDSAPAQQGGFTKPSQQQAPQHPPAQQAPQQQAPGGFDDFDDDIPF